MGKGAGLKTRHYKSGSGGDGENRGSEDPPLQKREPREWRKARV
jgi:hypothetical protein